MNPQQALDAPRIHVHYEKSGMFSVCVCVCVCVCVSVCVCVCVSVAGLDRAGSRVGTVWCAKARIRLP